MNERKPDALAIIDTQRGFITATEGERLNVAGFGELPVPNGEAIIEKINQLTEAFTHATGTLIATTQDWHPVETAHIDRVNPNYVDTWPAHCIADTPGAELHPDLLVAQNPEIATRFIKGDIACETPEEDTSYTGALAYNPDTNVLLPDWLREKRANRIYVVGLALGDGAAHPLCVDSTARDLHEQGFEVTLITDAAEAVLPENREVCFRNLAAIGIHLMTTEEALATVGA